MLHTGSKSTALLSVCQIAWNYASRQHSTLHTSLELTELNPQGFLKCRGRAKSHALGMDTHDYNLDLELYGAVDEAKSKISVTVRHVVLVIAKKEGSDGFWPRLTSEKAKQPYIKVCIRPIHRLLFRSQQVLPRLHSQI